LYQALPEIKMISMQSVNLTEHFLIAMPAMTDPYFSRTLVYIAEHNEQGALGVIVNRPIDMNLATLFENIEVPLEAEGFADLPVFFGGPVQTDRGFVLHRPIGAWQSTLTVNPHVGLTSSRDVLQAVAREGQPQDIMVTLGYSGWSAGQLEQELAQNAWLTVPAKAHILFDLPYEDRLASAMESLGIDFTNLAEGAGHA
jgi:putative transcriptional regulator